MKKIAIICLITLLVGVVLLCACGEESTQSEIIITTAVETTTSKTDTTKTTETGQTQQITTVEDTTKATETQTTMTETTETTVVVVDVVTYEGMKFELYADEYDEENKPPFVGGYPIPRYSGIFDSSSTIEEKMYGIGYLLMQGDTSVLIGDEEYSAKYNVKTITAKNTLICVMDSHTTTGLCYIYDYSGNLIKTLMDKDNAYDVSSLPNGEYIIAIECAHKKSDYFLSNGKIVNIYDEDYMTYKLVKQ